MLNSGHIVSIACGVFSAKRLFILGVAILTSCEENSVERSGPRCPFYENVPSPPYGDPIWHPSGNIIGFNHKPLKEIRYTHGYDCPKQAQYIYHEDSVGFWTVRPDGSEKRRVLNFKLLTPAWSPDGRWIAFANGGEIFKMPFDGQNFDTTAVTRLTSNGNNFFPSWSPDGQSIAYDNSSCGSAVSPAPINGCGILTMDALGKNPRFIAAERRMPYWGNSPGVLYSYGNKYDLEEGTHHQFFDARSSHISFYAPPRFSPDGQTIAFIGYQEGGGVLKLYAMSRDGKDLRTISSDTILSFSWSPSGKIVYVKGYDESLNSTDGTIWIMEGDGEDQRPVTFNTFVTTE